jgi:serine/threonine protein phosphatase 1
MSKTIIIGDIHGCIKELEALVARLNLTPQDHVISIGDLIDKGPSPVAVVKFMLRLSQTCKVDLVLGNHEEKFLRYLYHIQHGTGFEKAMQGTDEFKPLLQELNQDAYAFLIKSYYTYHIPKHNILLVHGGFLKHMSFALPESYIYNDPKLKKLKDISLITKTRYLNAAGKFVALGQEKPEDLFWAETYNGQYGHVIFGHQAFMQEQAKSFTHATGIDTGCVFGGWLTACCIAENGTMEFVSEKALKKYAPYQNTI